MTTNQTFGQAIEALKEGKRVSREGWNGKNMFVFQRPSDELEMEFIIEKVKSIPQSVKDYYKTIVETAGNDDTRNFLLKQKVALTAYLCMYAADGSIVNGWLASQTDMLSSDWCILD